MALLSLKALKSLVTLGKSDQTPDHTNRGAIWDENDATECLELDFRVSKSIDSGGLHMWLHMEAVKADSGFQQSFKLDRV